MTDPKGLILDWGGVLTAPLHDVTGAWANVEGVEYGPFIDVLRSWRDAARDHGHTSPSERLERGELDESGFEQALADALAERGTDVRPDGLLARITAPLASLQQPMLDLVADVRERGVRTALLSNSWGENYPQELWQVPFDALVISGREGLRKPEPEIFRLTAERLGLVPQQCVMVDDLPENVEAARAVGMIGLHHTDQHQTIGAVHDLFRI